MNKYAAYSGPTWQFDVTADNEAEALQKAKDQDSSVTHVVLVSETGGRVA